MINLYTYDVELEFIDGTKVVVEVEANNDQEAYDLAMPQQLCIIRSNDLGV
jgi:hypothetical protein